MLRALNCPNCGAPVSSTSSGLFVVCTHCNSTIGNLLIYGRTNPDTAATSGEQPGQVDRLGLMCGLGDWNGLVDLSDQILATDPTSVAARCYKSLAIFWLGDNGFSHLEKVKKLLNQAKAYAPNDPLVESISDILANDIMLTAIRNENFGPEFTDAVYALTLANDIGKPSSSVGNHVVSYIQGAVNRLSKELWIDLRKHKKNYDPPYRSIQLLYHCGRLIDNTVSLECFWLFGSLHASKNASKSYSADLVQQLETTKQILKTKQSDQILRQIGFDFFGNPKEVAVTR